MRQARRPLLLMNPLRSPDSKSMGGDGMTLCNRPRRWWLWVGWWTAVFVVMHVPLPEDALGGIAGADVVVHFIVFFVLTSLGASCLRNSRAGSSFSAIVLWALIYIGYAALDEWLQRFVRRTPSVVDWLFDVGGIVMATGIALMWERRSRERLSEPGPDEEAL